VLELDQHRLTLVRESGIFRDHEKHILTRTGRRREDSGVTSYNRRGHYRRGPNGQQVWVSGHTVNRSGSASYSPFAPYKPRPQVSARSKEALSPVTTPTTALPRSASFMRPNTACPVCGALVYFYANEFGSRVYFDEVGPPWPKHPCTIAPPSQTKERASRLRVAPTLYAGFVWSKPRTGTTSPAGTPHVMYFVERYESESPGTVMYLRRQHPQGPIEVWQTRDLIRLLPSQIVFIVGNQLSYLHPQSLEIVETEVSPQTGSRQVSFWRRLWKGPSSTEG